MLKVWGRRSSFNLQKVMWLVGGWGCRTSIFRLAAISASTIHPNFWR
jgi:hypothetical protein